jgi:hypothetical protein
MTTKKTKKNEDYAYFELNGTVDLVEVKDGKTTRSTIDGKLVLQALASVLEQEMRNEDQDKEAEKAKKPKRNRSPLPKQRRKNEG